MGQTPRPRRRSTTTPAIAQRCARQHGVASGPQIIAIGLGRGGINRRVEAGTLFRFYDDVYSLSPVLSHDGWRAAACLAVPNGRTMLRGWSTLELLGVAPRPDARHHIVTQRDVRRRDGLAIHRTTVDLPYRRIRSIPTTEPLRALVDLAVDLSGRPLQKLVGEALYHRVVRDEDVDHAALRYPGHPGLANLGAISPHEARARRTVLPLAERMLLALDTLPIPRPICEHPVVGFSGRRYRADFAWEEERVILEADGRAAHERREQMQKDRMRDADLLAVGWRTLRFTGRQFARERARFDQLVCATLGVWGEDRELRGF